MNDNNLSNDDDNKIQFLQPSTTTSSSISSSMASAANNNNGGGDESFSAANTNKDWDNRITFDGNIIDRINAVDPSAVEDMKSRTTSSNNNNNMISSEAMNGDVYSYHGTLHDDDVLVYTSYDSEFSLLRPHLEFNELDLQELFSKEVRGAGVAGAGGGTTTTSSSSSSSQLLGEELLLVVVHLRHHNFMRNLRRLRLVILDDHQIIHPPNMMRKRVNLHLWVVPSSLPPLRLNLNLNHHVHDTTHLM